MRRNLETSSSAEKTPETPLERIFKRLEHPVPGHRRSTKQVAEFLEKIVLKSKKIANLEDTQDSRSTLEAHLFGRVDNEDLTWFMGMYDSQKEALLHVIQRLKQPTTNRAEGIRNGKKGYIWGREEIPWDGYKQHVLTALELYARNQKDVRPIDLARKVHNFMPHLDFPTVRTAVALALKELAEENKIIKRTDSVGRNVWYRPTTTESR